MTDDLGDTLRRLRTRERDVHLLAPLPRCSVCGSDRFAPPVRERAFGFDAHVLECRRCGRPLVQLTVGSDQLVEMLTRAEEIDDADEELDAARDLRERLHADVLEEHDVQRARQAIAGWRVRHVLERVQKSKGLGLMPLPVDLQFLAQVVELYDQTTKTPRGEGETT